MPFKYPPIKEMCPLTNEGIAMRVCLSATNKTRLLVNIEIPFDWLQLC